MPYDEDYRELVAAPAEGGLRLLDAWNVRHGDMPRAPTAGLHGYKWPDKPACYDYFFVTEDLAARVAEINVQSETSASDHQPIVLDLA
jgi:endonuclease/exonuclease/phosphatase family metal-dependent hydrolase